MPRESMLTQRSIVADDTLSSLTGQPKGALLSYTELTKLMHQYIRTKGLRLKACPNCNAQVPGYATFCDKCGKDIVLTQPPAAK
jgi:ribosomal protein L40E